MGYAEDTARINQLVNQITKYRAGYAKGRPEISDAEYDAVERELACLDPNHPILQAIGHKSGGVRHIAPMLSLAKCYNVGDFMAWSHTINGGDAKMKVLLGMPKYDGVAMELRYTGSGSVLNLQQAVTRGDGVVGEDVTANVLRVRNIPDKIANVDRLSMTRIRGEILIFRKDFERINETMPAGKKYKSARNLASGTLGLDDHDVAAQRNLHFVAYNSTHVSKTLSGRYRVLAGLGFSVPQNILVTVDGAENAWKVLAEKRPLAYDIDGVVFAVDDLKTQEAAGFTAHHPKGFIAWKFEAETAITTLREVIWQVSRTGLLTPVAVFNPVELDGATITRANLVNVSEIERLQLDIGLRIKVARQGGTIPKVLGCVDDIVLGQYPIAKTCPECGLSTVVRISEEGIKTLHCENVQCGGRDLAQILHYVECMEIEDLGPSMVGKLMAAGFVKTVPDLYALMASELMSLSGVQERKAKKLVENIYKNVGHASFPKFLEAIGIPGVGKTLARDLAAHFRSLYALRKASVDDLMAVNGIEIKTATQIKEYLEKPDTRTLIVALTEYVNGKIPILTFDYSEFEIKTPENTVLGPLSGKKCVITGTFSVNRIEISDLITKNGGKVVDSVSKSTDYVLIGEKPGSKAQKAVNLGISMLDEAGFRALISDNAEPAPDLPPQDMRPVEIASHMASNDVSGVSNDVGDIMAAL
jgi:DNA ligase (NAD+)